MVKLSSWQGVKMYKIRIEKKYYLYNGYKSSKLLYKK